MRAARIVAALCTLLGALALSPAANAVVGGQSAGQGWFPFMASIQDRDGFAFCGGSILNSRWVLTAAHCVEGGNPANLRVVTGRANLNDTSRGQVLGVDAIRVHPQYDAAVLHLTAATTSSGIAQAGATDNDLEAAGTRVTVAGWGDRLPTLGLFAPSQLKYAELKVVKDGKCRTNLGFDAVSEVCAQAPGRDSCQGDSGGPLWGVKNGRWIQIGIVSYGTSCAVLGVPGVYTEVNNPSIRSFISSNTGA